MEAPHIHMSRYPRAWGEGHVCEANRAEEGGGIRIRASNVTEMFYFLYRKKI